MNESQILTQATDQLFQYDRWRRSFLQTILRIMVVLGLVLFAANFRVFTPVELIAFIIAYALLFVITFAPIAYSAKAGTLLATGYFAGVYTLISFGPWSGASLYFLGVTLFAVLLFDERVDLWVFAVSILTVAGIATFHITGSLALLSEKLPQTTPGDWLSYGVNFLALALTLLWAVNLLKNEFRTVADQFQSALGFLSKDRAELEKRVDERTAGLTKRTEQLRAASYIARQTADLQEINNILNAAVNLITDQFGFYHTGIFLMSEAGDEVILQAASSEGGKRMIEKGHALKVGTQGIVGYVAANKKPRIALDVGIDAVFFNNPDLPNTHSEMALPLLIRNKVLGVLDIQSDQPRAFTAEDTDILQALTDQVAVAIENARLLADAQVAMMQIEALSSSRTTEAWSRVAREGNYAYTYTPLGLSNGKSTKGADSPLEIPISLRGQKIGAIAITRKDNTPWSEIEKDLISEVAYQTGLAVDNVRLVEEATKRAQQEQTVGELAARFSQSLDIDSLLQTAARELGRVNDVSEVSVYIGQIPEQNPLKSRPKNGTNRT